VLFKNNSEQYIKNIKKRKKQEAGGRREKKQQFIQIDHGFLCVLPEKEAPFRGGERLPNPPAPCYTEKRAAFLRRKRKEEGEAYEIFPFGGSAPGKEHSWRFAAG
jgi:hypothetical protein